MRVLQDKVILVTGALGQLGRSAIPLFLKKGAIVVAGDQKSIQTYPEVEQTIQEYDESRFYFIQADLNEEAAVSTMLTEVAQKFGRLDGLYHNCYTNIVKPVLEQSLADWEDSIRGTLTSTFLVCRYALPLMIETGGGAIVNTSSVLSQIPQKGNAAYGAGKAGINQLTRVIAVENADKGIRANVLVPGDFKSDEALARMGEPFRDTMRRATLIGRSGSPDEINEVAAFLLSDAASYVTASLFTADGGYRL